MLIVYLSSSTIPSQKANSIQVMKMCNAFSESGHKVVLFAKSLTNSNDSFINKIRDYYGTKNYFDIYHIQASNIRLLGGLEYAFKVLKKIKELKIYPDLFYGRNLYALIACSELNIPIIYESHAAPVLGRNSLERFLFSKPQFKKLIVINKALYQYYKSKFEIFNKYPEKIILAPDGANIEDFNSNKVINDKKPLIGYAGSLYQGKGIEMIINLAQIMPELNFTIAGGTPQQIEHFNSINKLKNLSFEGFISPSKISDFLSKCDILLAPYSDKIYSEDLIKYKIHDILSKYNIKTGNHINKLYEFSIYKSNISDWMSPLKIFEYMASKKPIIASNLPAIKEILEDNKTALLAEYNNVLDWKKSIVKILCKPNMAKKLSENAFELLKSKYTWKQRVETILKDINIETGIKSAHTKNKFNVENQKSNNIILSHHLSPQKANSISLPLNNQEKSCQKIVILHIIGDLNAGGAERNMLKIIPKLNNQQFQHRILTLFNHGDLAKELQKKGIIVETASIPRTLISMNTPFAIIKLIKAIKRINPSIIHTWLYHSNNLINILSPFFPTKTIINSIRHDNPNAGSQKTKISARIGAYISKLTPKITVFCSQSSFENHKNIGYNTSKSIVIPNGFIIKEINKENANKELKHQLNIPDNHKVAITAARYTIEKDYPTLLKAIKLTIEKNDRVSFVLCGKGVDKSNLELMKLIRQLNIENNIHLLGHQSKIENLMAGADFLISSSYSEAFPNVIAEAMSLGVPCLASDTGATYIIMADTGLITEPSNPEKLSKDILKFLNYDNSHLTLLGTKAKERIKNNFSLETCLLTYEKLYEALNQLKNIKSKEILEILNQCLTEISHNDNLKQ